MLRALLATIAILLVYASSVSAECAWVLWQEVDGRIEGARVLKVYDTRQDCDLAASVFGDQMAEDAKAIGARLRLDCLPDTIDPFDSRSRGDTFFWKETYEFFHKGLVRLRDLLDAWNKREQAPPYVGDVRDLNPMIEFGAERLSKVGKHGNIYVNGISEKSIGKMKEQRETGMLAPLEPADCLWEVAPSRRVRTPAGRVGRVPGESVRRPLELVGGADEELNNHSGYDDEEAS